MTTAKGRILFLCSRPFAFGARLRSTFSSASGPETSETIIHCEPFFSPFPCVTN